ncbi:DNA-processing protein DprA [Thermosipho globiformans]|uniref:DNA-processing protein DprA n=1 Tax=Thermosipho globiformans TaxID=380685 RepID=UPI000F8DF8C9|nr:DNA-processing protein DprA [Thermosipho globiformans]
MTKVEIATLSSLGYSINEIKNGYIKSKDIQRKKFIENKLTRWLEFSGNGILTIFDDEYPEYLKNVWKPPVVLFYKGNVHLLKKICFSVVGTRSMTVYGKNITEKFVKKLSDFFVIVSGMAIGIDAEAHKNSKKTIAVLGCGVDICYPKQNKNIYDKISKEGCLISEYLPWENPKKHYFPLRNRIIAGISEGVLIVECKKKSGTMITANYAIDFGKDLFTVPGNIFSLNSEGPNFLIKNGAYPVTDPDEILDFYIMRGVINESNRKN